MNLIAESNASNVVLALNAHQQSPNYVGSIIRDCVSFKGSFRSLNFLHVKREASQAAHYLATYAFKNLDCIWIEETPPYISTVLHLIYCQNFVNEIVFNVKKKLINCLITYQVPTTT